MLSQNGIVAAVRSIFSARGAVGVASNELDADPMRFKLINRYVHLPALNTRRADIAKQAGSAAASGLLRSRATGSIMDPCAGSKKHITHAHMHT